MFNIKVIFFDTETSGLDCSRCNIIELALLTVEDGVITETYDEFIDVGVHGIDYPAPGSRHGITVGSIRELV